MKKVHFIANMMALSACLCMLFVFMACGADDENHSTDNAQAPANSNDTTKTTLSAPTVIAEAIDYQTVLLNWDKVPNATLYYIYYGKNTESKKQYGYYPINKTEADVKPLDANTTYYFWVRAANDENIMSDYSKVVYATTKNNSSSSSSSSTTTKDNSLLTNVERIDDYCIPKVSLNFTNDKKGIRVNATLTTDNDRYDPEVIIFYRSTTLTNDFKAYKKIDSKQYSNSLVYYEDYDVQFNAGDKYYYIAVAADSEGDIEGTYSSNIGEWICGDTTRICFSYSTSKSTDVVVGIDDDIEWSYTFTKSKNLSEWQNIKPGKHTVWVSEDNGSNLV